MPFSNEDCEIIYPNQISQDEYLIQIDKILLNYNFQKAFEIIYQFRTNKCYKSVDDLIRSATNLLFDVVENNFIDISSGVWRVIRTPYLVELLFYPIFSLIS